MDIITREMVTSVVTPKATATWHPIPHGDVLTLVETSAKVLGLEIVAEHHTLDKEGARYFGTLNLKSETDYSTVIGLRNSHDKRFKAGVACGSHVFVCANLCFSGEVEIGRKHTKNILDHFPKLVEEAVGKVIGMREKQSVRFNAYKNTRMSNFQLHDFLIRSVDQKVIPISKLPHILKLWRGEEGSEWTDDHEATFTTHTMWRAFNAYTSVLKGSNVFELSGRTRELHALADTFCGVN